MSAPRSTPQNPPDARQLSRALARYRTPDPARSVLELTVTLAPFVATWAVACWMLSHSVALAMVLALGNAAFLVRLFMIQHDCGHGSFFRSRRLCDWLGRGIGVITLTPYDVWRETHSIHHASTGNLDRRGVGDLPTMTVAEYRAKGSDRTWPLSACPSSAFPVRGRALLQFLPSEPASRRTDAIGMEVLAQRHGDERGDCGRPDRPRLVRRLAGACLRVPSHDASRGDDRYVVLLRPAPVRTHELESRGRSGT
jgi:hypothetical protein